MHGTLLSTRGLLLCYLVCTYCKLRPHKQCRLLHELVHPQTESSAAATNSLTNRYREPIGTGAKLWAGFCCDTSPRYSPRQGPQGRQAQGTVCLRTRTL